jgi:hypothetical protein
MKANGITFTVEPEKASTVITLAGIQDLKVSLERMVSSQAWADWVAVQNGKVTNIAMIYTNGTQAAAAWSGYDKNSPGTYAIAFNPTITYRDTMVDSSTRPDPKLSSNYDPSKTIIVPHEIVIFHEVGHSLIHADVLNIPRWENALRREMNFPERAGYTWFDNR